MATNSREIFPPFVKLGVIRWGPAVAWAGFIFLLSSYSSLPGPSIIWWDFVFKKSAHMIVYGVLFYLVGRAFHWQTDRRFWLAVWLTTMAYAVSDELHQAFVPGRTALPSDIGYDSLGVFVAYYRLRNWL